MNQDLEHLIVLQAQDLELARLRAEVSELPRRLQRAEAELQAAETALAGLRAQLGAEEKLRRGQESEAATQRAKADRLRRSLDAATSAAQVAAFEREIGFATASIATLEDEELASMERSEVLDQELRQSEALAGQRRDALEAERIRGAAVAQADALQIAGVEEQRGQLRPQISETWLATYDRLRKAKGTAVAEAVGNATQGQCAHCQMGVRPQRWQDLIGREHEDEIFACESCGRLLFWDPRRDTPRFWSAGERLQAAQAGSSR